MKKVKISVDLSGHNYADKELNVKTDNIIECLTDNSNFPTLSDQLAPVKTKNDYFGSLIVKMEQGNKQITSEKKKAREDLENALRSLAGKVQDISGGDEAIILTSGFDINRKPTTVGELEQPKNVIVKQGTTSASLEVSWSVVAHASSYEVRYTKAPLTDASVFTTSTTTKHKVNLDNLELRESYLVQIAGIGSDPKRIWSVAVTSCYVS